MGCGASTEGKGAIFKSPGMAGMMQGKMRNMMNGMMKVTKHNNDCTQQEVADFMVPSSVGNEFKDLPGTFDPKMEGRIKEKMMGGMMVMDRIEMVKAGPPHNKGITWEKYNEHRGYTTPGYVEKSPMVGDDALDGKILDINDPSKSSTLLAEAKKLAGQANSNLVILAFCGITCPFYRAYAAEDLWKAVKNSVPVLHCYIREAEPCDVFDAGGMHMTTPLAMAKPVPWHKSEPDRADIARRTKQFFEASGMGPVTMWMDCMDDALEDAYEARPWRWYVMDVTTGKITAKLGLAPFNMDGKCAVISKATA